MPGYTAGYVGRGSRFNPFASDDPSTKRRRLDIIEDALTAAGQSEAAAYLEGLNDSLGTGPLAPRLPEHRGSRAPLSFTAAKSRLSGRMSRTRWRSRRRRRKTFNAKVGRALLRFKETKRFITSVSQATFAAGDGTTRVLYIANPIGDIGQGVDAEASIGDSMWIKALALRGRISLDQTTNSLRVRILCIWSQSFADLDSGFQTYGNTTTASTNPTQQLARGEQNVRIFETSDAEETGQPSAPYVGNASGIDIIDGQQVKVLGGREFFLSTQHLLNFTNFNIYIPVNRRWRQQRDFGVTDADQTRSFLDGNYYWILQVFSNSNANNILAAQDILGTFDIVTYFKDLA